MNYSTLHRTMIRRAKFQDARAIATLLADSFHPDQPHPWMRWTQPFLRTGITQDIEQRLIRPAPTYACLVAVVRDTTIGTIEISQRSIPGDWWRQSSNGETPIYIANLAVAMPWRRQGIGRALLIEAETIAHSWQQPALYLHVMADNPSALTLYTRLGYAVEKADKKWPLFCGQPTQKLLMCKSLS